MKCRVRIAALAVAVVVVATGARAQAEPQRKNSADAEALFYKARALMHQGRYAEACPTLEASLRLDAGIGTRFNLADCNEHIGKTATAWAGFNEVAAAAKASHQAERESVAKKRAQALEPRLPKLVVDVPEPAGLSITRDGVVVPPATYGVEVPVDPGIHRVAASAPGKQAWEVNVHSVQGKSARVTVPGELPALAALAALAAPPAATSPEPEPVASGATTSVTYAPTETTSSAFPAPVVENPLSVQRVAGWALAGAGVIGAGVGIGFGLASIGDRNESRVHCVGDLCDADGVRMRDDAIRHGNVATVAVLAGAAAIAGGLALVLTAPRGVESPERAPAVSAVRAAPSVAREGGGLVLEGIFQ